MTVLDILSGVGGACGLVALAWHFAALGRRMAERRRDAAGRAADRARWAAHVEAYAAGAGAEGSVQEERYRLARRRLGLGGLG